MAGESFEGVATAKQHFTSVPDDLIDKLIKKGDIFSCAGGFTVEDMSDYCGYGSNFPTDPSLFRWSNCFVTLDKSVRGGNRNHPRPA